MSHAISQNSPDRCDKFDSCNINKLRRAFNAWFTLYHHAWFIFDGLYDIVDKYFQLYAYMITMTDISDYMPYDMEYVMMSLYAICMLCVYGVIQLSLRLILSQPFF